MTVQRWPLPSTSPTVPATVPLPAALQFAGRFVDSSFVPDRQITFRTARARAIKDAPDRNRVYVMLGSAVASYDRSKLFARLSSGEPLALTTSAPVRPANTCPTGTESYLAWDKFFYAEYTTDRNGYSWVTRIIDGQDRLWDFDWDDRGYVYVATAFGWGIVQDDGTDDGGLMTTMHQEYGDAVDYSLTSVCAFKAAGRYYLLIPGQTSVLFDVTDPTAPVRLPDVQLAITKTQRINATRIAVTVIDSTGQSALRIYDTSSTSFPTSSIVTVLLDALDHDNDGATVWALRAQAIVRINSDGTQVSIPIPSSNSFIPGNIHYGAGYIAIGGQGAGPEVRLFKLAADSRSMTEIDLDGFLSGYYYGRQGYEHAGFLNLTSATPLQEGTNIYLAVPASGLGDVYLLEGNAPIPPPLPPPVVVPPVIPPVVPPVIPPTSGGCPKMTSVNIAIAVNGSSADEQTFNVGDLLMFAVSGFNYWFACAVHHFRWSDVAETDSLTLTWRPTIVGRHTIACTITNPTDSYTASITVNVVGVVPVVPVETISGYLPTQARVGKGAFTLHVYGANFLPTDQIAIEGDYRPTVVVSPGEATCQITDDDVATVATWKIGVGHGGKDGTPYVGAVGYYQVVAASVTAPAITTLDQAIAAIVDLQARVAKLESK